MTEDIQRSEGGVKIAKEQSHAILKQRKGGIEPHDTPHSAVVVAKGPSHALLKQRKEGTAPQHAPHTASEVAEVEMVALLRTVVLAKVFSIFSSQGVTS